ncbi:cell surface receptor/MFS transporter (FLVCR) [Aspergillus flavus AF70]|nr:cell surface receptor/MFS transporter (FLVCR) [Aspergillus flavus AF70]
MPFSHHSHSGEFCPSHAQNTLEQVIQTAILQGMEVFCLSEHMPRSSDELYEEEIEAGVTSSSMISNEAKYFMTAIQLRKKYASQIKILVGFESEWIRSDTSLRLIHDSLSRHPFEFFVGSVHHLHGIPIDWSRKLYSKAREVSGGTDERIFEDYFDVQFEMLQNLKPMIVGHFDLIRLHSDNPNASDGGFRRWTGVWQRVARNLRYISSYGGLLELNSAALRKGLEMPYPAAEVCQEFLALDGRFCLSDDSHGIAHVGAMYQEMLKYVEEQGIQKLYFLELAPDGTNQGFYLCLLLILSRPSQIETMVDNADIKCKSPGGSRPVTCTGPSSFDLGPGYQAPIVRKVYKRRFIGVAHLALLNIVVSWDWVTYPTVPVTSAEFLGVSVNAITWLSTSTLFAYCVSAPFVFHTVERMGLRGSNIVASVLLLVGNWIRYAGTVSAVKNYGVAMFGQIVIGLAQPFCLSTPSKFSDSWFTDQGRTSATAIATLANPLGAALGQFANPYLAKIPDDLPRMVLIISIISSVASLPSLFIPSKPPTPPSAAAAVNRTPLLVAFKDIAEKRDFWLLSLPFSIYVALFNSTITLINQAVIPYGATEEEAGIAGGILIGAGLLGAAIISPLNDRFKWYTGTIRILFPITCAMYISLVFAPASSWGIWPTYLVCAILGFSSFSLVPVLLELLAELTFPHSPEIGSTISWLGGQIFGAVFIIAQSAMIAGPTGNPPYNMHKSLVFSAILSGVFLPLPLLLNLFGDPTVRQREQIHDEVITTALVASSSMSFFSDSRLNALSACLGNDALKSLITRISHMVKSRVEVLHRNLGPSSIWNQSGEVPRLSPDRRRHLIDMFFENIHPLHPFLDRHEFESRAFAPTLQADLANGVSWTALYYTVLALGCEFDGGGSFAPGDGEAWGLFKVALDLYPRVLLLNTDLLEVQAVFCLNLSGTQIQGKIISEAARVAQRAFLNKASTSSDAIIRSRAFWVVYYIEKTVTFHHGTTSFIVDCDVGSPIPIVQEAVFGDFDWFLTSVRFARLYSRTFTDLFSISATNNSKTAYLAKINQLERLLEQQCQTIPPQFRPGTKLRPQTFSHPCEIAAALRVHYHYHELKIALHRLKLHVTRDQSSSQSPADIIDMMKSARAVIDLTRVIYQEPSTPFFIMIFMPLTALFILFDLVVHYPAHPDARSNLVLLESVTGYFSALEYATSGYLPGSMLIQFASIVRTFHSSSHPAQVEDINNGNSGMGTTLGHPSPETLGTGSSTNSQMPWEVKPDLKNPSDISDYLTLRSPTR